MTREIRVLAGEGEVVSDRLPCGEYPAGGRAVGCSRWETCLGPSRLRHDFKINPLAGGRMGRGREFVDNGDEERVVAGGHVRRQCELA